MKPTVRGRNVAINIYVTIVTQMINETLYIFNLLLPEPQGSL